MILSLLVPLGFFDVAGALLGSRVAAACSCTEVPFAASRDGASFVFLGRVASISSGPTKDVRFDVLRVFKGAVPSQMLTQTRDGAACGLGVVTGETYLIYAYQNGDDPPWLSGCSRSSRLAAASADLALLGDGSAPTALPPAPSPLGASVAPTLLPGPGTSRSTPEPSKTRGCGGCSVGAAVTEPWGIIAVLTVWLALIGRRRAVQPSTARG